MKPLARFWNEGYRVDRPLEADSWLRRGLNRYIVAALMNTFPNAATRLFSRSSGELARLLMVEREGGSFRVLRAMYEFEDRRRRGDVINRVLMQSPAVKAARNRRRIAQRMLEVCLKATPPEQPRLVLAIGAGDGSLEAEVITRSTQRNIYYCGVDKDERAVGETAKVLQKHGLQDRGITFLGEVARTADLEAVLDKAARRFGVRFDGVSVAVCQGIAEYLDVGSDSNEALSRMLTAVRRFACDDGSLIISQTDFHDRVKYLERGLSWHMRLRSADEVAREVEKAGWRISICEQEPMKLITMCLAAKSDLGYRRLDRESPSKQTRVPRRTPSAGKRRRWAWGR